MLVKQDPCAPRDGDGLSLPYRDHRVLIRRRSPHHVRPSWIGIRRFCVAQGLARRAEQHDMCSGDDPMAIRIFRRLVGASVARAAGLARRAGIAVSM